jgi:hypothetical protein
MNLLMLQSKLELKLIKISDNKLNSTRRFHQQLTIKHGRSILRKLNSTPIMLSIMRRKKTAKENVNQIEKILHNWNSIMKDLKINMKHLKPNLLRILQNSSHFNLSLNLTRILLSQLMFKLKMLQQHMPRMMQEFHTLMLVVLTIQVPLLWIQTA